MTTHPFDNERYSVGHSEQTNPRVWYVIDNITDEIISTHALASQADDEARNLNDNEDERRGVDQLEQNFRRYWEGM